MIINNNILFTTLLFVSLYGYGDRVVASNDQDTRVPTWKKWQNQHPRSANTGAAPADSQKSNIMAQSYHRRKKWHGVQASSEALDRQNFKKPSLSYAPENSLSSLLAPSALVAREYDQGGSSYSSIPVHTQRLIHHVKNHQESAMLIWVHIPKTGSTFCLSMSRAQCPYAFNDTCTALSSPPTTQTYRDEGDVYLKQGCATTGKLEKSCEVATIKDHGPLFPELLMHLSSSSPTSTSTPASVVDMTTTLKLIEFQPPRKRLVMMMRNPESRVISMFADCRHTVGFNGHSLLSLNERMSNYSTDKCKHIRRSKPQYKTCIEAQSFSLFVKHPAAIGCVTKTLTGRYCNEPVILSSKDLSKATKILTTFFFFVGIFEKWDESIRTFHRLRGDLEEPCRIELGHNRQRPPNSEEVTQALYNILHDNNKQEQNKRRREEEEEVNDVISPPLYSRIDPFDSELYVEANKMFASYSSRPRPI
jgi:hypothetical protein